MNTKTTKRTTTAAHRRRGIRSRQRRLADIGIELPTLRAEEEDEREDQRSSDDTRRKLLAGRAVLERTIQRAGRIRWLRKQLDSGLTRAADRDMFRLEDDGPLIPPEDWPGWPDLRRTETQAVASGSRTSAARRRRIAYLERQEKVLKAELKQLMKDDEPERVDRNNQRKILVGVVILRCCLSNLRLTRWLRRLLDNEYTDARDRRLYQLEEDGPIVREEDQAGLVPTRGQAPKRKAPDDGGPAARAADAPGRRSTSQRAKRAGRAGSSTRRGAVRAPDPERDGDDAGKSGVPGPIPGWCPRSIRASRSSDSEVGSRRKAWGAVLEGRAAVAELPEELRGKRITVTDSNTRSWTTTITEVVSRDESSILVRHEGRPGFG